MGLNHVPLHPTVALPTEFVLHGKRDELLQIAGLDADGIPPQRAPSGPAAPAMPHNPAVGHAAGASPSRRHTSAKLGRRGCEVRLDRDLAAMNRAGEPFDKLGSWCDVLILAGGDGNCEPRAAFAGSAACCCP